METEKWALLWVHLPNRFLYPYYSLVNMPTQITKEPSITGACIWPTPSGVNSCFTLETSPYVSPRRDKKEIRKVIRRKEEEENADELNTKFSELKFWDMCRRQCGGLPFISKEQWCEGCLNISFYRTNCLKFLFGVYWWAFNSMINEFNEGLPAEKKKSSWGRGTDLQEGSPD